MIGSFQGRGDVPHYRKKDKCGNPIAYFLGVRSLLKRDYNRGEKRNQGEQEQASSKGRTRERGGYYHRSHWAEFSGGVAAKPLQG